MFNCFPSVNSPQGVTMTAGKSVEFFANCRVSWDEARGLCGKRGGKLWEPASLSEYDQVFAGIGYSSSSRQPQWLFAYFHWWIGMRSPGSGAGTFANYHTTGAPATWCGLTENSPDEECVDIYGNKDNWGDHGCSLRLPFICEIPRKCEGCSYNGKTFPDGATLEINAKCCTKTTCKKGVW